MNDAAMREVVQKEAKVKFRGQQKLNTKVAVYFPENLVREYIRVTDAYMKLLQETVAKHLPKIKAAAKREQELARADDIQDLAPVIRAVFQEISVELESRAGAYGLEKKLAKLANLSRKLTIKEWKKVCKATLGIDILDDYYLGEFYRESLKKWTEENVDLIKTIPKTALGDMQNIVQDGFKTGKTTTSIVREIQRTYGVEKRHARLIARDQMAKLNADLTKSQQQDAGVEEYVWSTSGDGRVRDRHKALNGKTFSWNDPPVVDVRTGRRGHPGQDYQCRCVALPKFNINTLDLPIAKSGKEAVELKR